MRLLLLAVIILGICPKAPRCFGQSAEQRLALESKIKEHAIRHAESNSAMQTKLMVDLYSDNRAQLSAEQIANLYEIEYSLNIKKKEVVWDKLKPNAGWIVAAILLALLAISEGVKKKIVSAVGWLLDRIYNRFAGWRPLRRMALNRYCRSLVEKYNNVVIPFRQDRPLEMREFFVPLELARLRRRENQEVDEKFSSYRAIEQNKRLMITGSPGSGKTMLIRQVALSYADPSYQWQLSSLPERPIPVVLELHRLSGADLSLEDQLTKAFARNRFPHANKLVQGCLGRGTLMLLFDGLDEVTSADRSKVVSQVRDFLDSYRNCRALITCRTAVYHDEFAGAVDDSLDVDEFSDQQIRRFLQPWESQMPREKSINQLMQTLADRPRIMALARNPLLLTIIAFLYTDTSDYILPQSRAEFYEEAADVLLRKWHQKYNQYDARDKKAILRHLALYIQDNAEARKDDRKSLLYSHVISQVRSFLPTINGKPEDAHDILKEIVDRSGLLLEIDNGERFQFGHLTLQEFYAADALAEDADGLKERFAADHVAWRETVKLWCGIVKNSTEMIDWLFKEDPITAFEALSDAQEVETDTADKSIAHFKNRLSGDADMDVIRAFGAVASVRRPRGRAVFQYLTERLNQGGEEMHSAAKALSLTNLEVAAEELVQHLKDSPWVFDLVGRMGDLAVPLIRDFALKGDESAISQLLTIGTPKAALSVVPLLWSTDESIGQTVAFALCVMLRSPGVEDELRGITLPKEAQLDTSWNWVWKPFEDSENSALSLICGKVAQLISADRDGVISDIEAFDERILVPVICLGSSAPNHACQSVLVDRNDDVSIAIAELHAAAKGRKELDQHSRREHKRSGLFAPDDSSWNDWISVLGHFSNASADDEILAKVRDSTISLLSIDDHWARLNRLLKPKVGVAVLTSLITSSNAPRRKDWEEIRQPLKYDFDDGWHRLVIAILTTVLGLLSVAAAIPLAWNVFDSSASNSAFSYFAVAWVLFYPYWQYRFWRPNDLNDRNDEMIFSYIGLLILVFERDLDDTLEYMKGLFFPAVAVFVTILLLSLGLNWWWVGLTWSAISACLIGLLLRAFELERRANNPLRGLI